MRQKLILILVCLLALSSCGQALQGLERNQKPPVPTVATATVTPAVVINPIKQLEEPAAIVGEAVAVGTPIPQFPEPPAPPAATDSEGAITKHEHSLGGGTVYYVIAPLVPSVRVRNIQADGAIPGSDETGDTIWTDGQKHGQRVIDMIRLDSSKYEGRTPVFAMAFGYHGEVRTSDEGTVRTDGVTYRTNFGRGVICISTKLNRAAIGLFKTLESLDECDLVAGAGPVFIVEGKIAGDAIPLNPLGEDFALMDWRREMYQNSLPKTMVCVIKGPTYDRLVFLNSNGVDGLTLAFFLRDTLGCTYGIQGDDDGSTQAVWRGEKFSLKGARGVPSALAVYSLE